MEGSDALSILCQCDSPEPSVVVVRRYINTPYIPRGTSQPLYLEVSTLSRDASSVQFPLEDLHLQRLLPHSKIKVLLTHKKGEMGLRYTPAPKRFYAKAL